MSQDNFATFWGSLVHSPIGATLASAAALPALTHPIHKVSGTTEITTITVPYEGFKGVVFIIPTGAFTFATGGSETTLAKPLATAFTAVASRPFVLICDGALWYVMAIA